MIEIIFLIWRYIEYGADYGDGYAHDMTTSVPVFQAMEDDYY